MKQTHSASNHNAWNHLVLHFSFRIFCIYNGSILPFTSIDITPWSILARKWIRHVHVSMRKVTSTANLWDSVSFVFWSVTLERRWTKAPNIHLEWNVRAAAEARTSTVPCPCVLSLLGSQNSPEGEHTHCSPKPFPPLGARKREKLQKTMQCSFYGHTGECFIQVPTQWSHREKEGRQDISGSCLQTQTGSREGTVPQRSCLSPETPFLRQHFL